MNALSLLRRLTPTGRSALVIGLTYTVGIAGLSVPALRPLFLALTPVHLLLTLTLLLAAERSGRPWALWLLVAALGYGIEVVGVNTGWIFGAYSYGPTLGLQLAHTPLLIGGNWLLLVVAASAVVAGWGLGGGARAQAVALLLVGLDWLMEPVAVAMHMWAWAGGGIPLQNYVGWLATALGLAALYAWRVPRPQNALAGWVLGWQLLFFACLRLTFVPGAIPS